MREVRRLHMFWEVLGKETSKFSQFWNFWVATWQGHDSKVIHIEWCQGHRWGILLLLVPTGSSGWLKIIKLFPTRNKIAVFCANKTPGCAHIQPKGRQSLSQHNFTIRHSHWPPPTWKRVFKQLIVGAEVICLYSQLTGNIWRALLRSLPERKHMEEDWRGGGRGNPYFQAWCSHRWEGRCPHQRESSLLLQCRRRNQKRARGGNYCSCKTTVKIDIDVTEGAAARRTTH